MSTFSISSGARSCQSRSRFTAKLYMSTGSTRPGSAMSSEHEVRSMPYNSSAPKIMIPADPKKEPATKPTKPPQGWDKPSPRNEPTMRMPEADSLTPPGTQTPPTFSIQQHSDNTFNHTLTPPSSQSFSTSEKISSSADIMDTFWDLQERPTLNFPSILSHLTPLTCKFITFTTDRRHLITNVTATEFEAWERKYIRKFRRDGLTRYSYNGRNRTFIIECTTSPYHSAFVDFFTIDGAGQLCEITGRRDCGVHIKAGEEITDFHSPDIGITRSRKTPDAIVSLKGDFLPIIAIEIGFTQDLPQLRADAELLLANTRGKVELVILIEIQEKQPSREHNNEYVDPTTALPLSNTAARKLKFQWPPGLDDKPEYLTPAESIRTMERLEEFYIQQDSRGELIPRLVESTDCSIHIYKLKVETQGKQLADSEYSNEAIAVETTRHGEMGASGSTSDDSGSAIDSDEGEDRVYRSGNAMAGDNAAGGLLDLIESYQFMVNDQFVQTLPPEKRSFRLQLCDLFRKRDMPDHLLKFADKPLEWDLEKFCNEYLIPARPGMAKKRARHRAQSVIKKMEDKEKLEESKRRKEVKDRDKKEGMSSGSKDTRNERMKRNINDTEVLGVDHPTHAQKKRRPGSDEDVEDVHEETKGELQKRSIRRSRSRSCLSVRRRK